MNPLVSVIIPVYNAGKTIERCIDSVLDQSYETLEIIVINDGSTDNTEDVLEKFKKCDARVTIINTLNKGVSEARNLGLEIATGEFVQFVDSDDFLVKDATEHMISAIMQNCEMIITDYIRVLDNREIVRGDIQLSGRITRTDFAMEMMKSPANFYYGVLWNKLYRLEIIKQHHLQFHSDLNWCEDFQFNLEYLEYVRFVYVLDKPTYCYVKTKGSLSSIGNSVKDVVNMKKVIFEQYKALYESMDLYEKNKMKIKRFYIDFARDSVKAFRSSSSVN